MATTSDPSAGFSHDAAVLSKTLKRLISRLALRQAQERLKAKLDEWEMGIFKPAVGSFGQCGIPAPIGRFDLRSRRLSMKVTSIDAADKNGEGLKLLKG